MKKHNHLFVKVPDPFDGSAQTRLIRMGVLDKNGQINKEAMSAFAGIFSGQFFEDLCDFYDDTKSILEIYKAFQGLYGKQDYQHMFLLFSMQHDYIRKPLPDPVWWLAGDNGAVREFMTLFMERFQSFAHAAGFLGGDEK